jgi:hypothetical protein
VQPTVTVKHGGQKNIAVLRAALRSLQKSHVYVGIPTTTAMDRKRQVMGVAVTSTGKRRVRLEKMAVDSGINNAELLYIHTHGSPRKHIPARPVIEAAISETENKKKIAQELSKVAQLALQGKPQEAAKQLDKAGQLGENVSRAWFTNPKNGWAPNAPSTIRRKGSSRPLIDTGSLRKAITHVVSK